jgi:DNA-binding NtrC family response regulator
MSGNNDFALVPRPPGALERAEPGAKRILSGMVADTLALAKKGPPRKSRPLRIVQVNDETGINESFAIVIRGFWPDATVLSFDNAVAALEELSQTDPDLLITDDAMAGICVSELCQRLLDRKVTYPIIVNSSWGQTEQWVREFANQGLNVSFLPLPCDVTSLRDLVEACLKTPRDLATPDETKPIKNQTKTPKPRGKLLIVDDEDILRQCMYLVFKDEYDLFMAGDGPTAIELAKQNDIDVAVTNIRMAGMSGIELLERLKFMKPDVEVIMMTGFETADSLHQSLRLGACDYINKPFDVPTMRAAISKAMQHRTLESETAAARKQSNSNMEIVADPTLLKRRGKLLVVDDEDGARQSLRVIFKDEYDVFMAGDGPTAIELAKQNDIDVVVTNICMPGMSGIELLERLKSLKPDIEVIIMTAFETTDTIRQALRLGACDYITKPFDFSTIRAAVSKAMQHRTFSRIKN